MAFQMTYGKHLTVAVEMSESERVFYNNALSLPPTAALCFVMGEHRDLSRCVHMNFAVICPVPDPLKQLRPFTFWDPLAAIVMRHRRRHLLHRLAAERSGHRHNFHPCGRAQQNGDHRAVRAGISGHDLRAGLRRARCLRCVRARIQGCPSAQCAYCTGCGKGARQRLYLGRRSLGTARGRHFKHASQLRNCGCLKTQLTDQWLTS